MTSSREPPLDGDEETGFNGLCGDARAGETAARAAMPSRREDANFMRLEKMKRSLERTQGGGAVHPTLTRSKSAS